MISSQNALPKTMPIFLAETPERSGQDPSRTYLFRWSACTLEDRRNKWGSFFLIHAASVSSPGRSALEPAKNLLQRKRSADHGKTKQIRSNKLIEKVN